MNCTLGGSFSLLLVRGSLPSFAPSFVLSLRRLLGICAWGSELLPQGPFPAGAPTLPQTCALPLFPLTFPKHLFFSWLLQKLNCASLLWETASSVPWCIPGEGLHFPEPTVPVGSTCQQGAHAIGTPPWGPASPQCQWGAHTRHQDALVGTGHTGGSGTFSVSWSREHGLQPVLGGDTSLPSFPCRSAPPSASGGGSEWDRCLTGAGGRRTGYRGFPPLWAVVWSSPWLWLPQASCPSVCESLKCPLSAQEPRGHSDSLFRLPIALLAFVHIRGAPCTSHTQCWHLLLCPRAAGTRESFLQVTGSQERLPRGGDGGERSGLEKVCPLGSLRHKITLVSWAVFSSLCSGSKMALVGRVPF